MPAVAAIPRIPRARRPELFLGPRGDDGQYVVKDRASGEYFHLGEPEYFLLSRLDGRTPADAICEAFERQFAEPLGEDGLDEFLTLAEGQGFLVPESRTTGIPRPEPAARTAASAESQVRRKPGPAAQRQSLLYFHASLFDPDRLFNRLEPRIRFVWTRGFLAASAVLILLAGAVVLGNGRELVTRFQSVSGGTLVLAWVALVAATTCHEFSHGLTCKHYGGEVHEVGFLLMYFMPCFYCDVSDAWLLPERSKRLWVTFAGGYCDLVLWALAVFVWRLTMQDTLVNYLAWIVLSVCGVRVFLNFNPLLKLDGYYLLSDWLKLPNLRQRSWDAAAARLRWALWGAPRPGAQPRGRFLLAFGVTSWLYSAFFLSLMVLWLVHLLGGWWGWAGALAGAAFGMLLMRGMFHGLSGGEFGRMIRMRWKRTAVLAALLGSAAAAAVQVEAPDRAGGAFQVRPITRAEVHAPIAGFVKDVRLEEGGRVWRGDVVAVLEIPSINNHILEKGKDLDESEARVTHCRNEVQYAREEAARIASLYKTATASEVEFREAQRRLRVCQSELEEARARESRLRTELTDLIAQSEKVVVRSPVSGVVTTPHLREKVGQYVHEGDLLCVVEEPSDLEAEIRVPEEEVAKVVAGAAVELKARAIPFRTFHGTVERTAPAAVVGTGELQGSVTVYCRVADATADLRPGMTGHARVVCGRGSVGRLAGERVLRYLRTEFWW